MTEEWTVTLLEGAIPWSDDWTPDTRRVDIDAQLLREIVELDAGDHGLFKTLVDMFRHDTEVHLPVLRDAATGGETATLSNLAHSLAGEAAQIGAASLAVHSRAIETAALRGDFRLCGALVDCFTEHLDQFATAVEHELDARGR